MSGTAQLSLELGVAAAEAWHAALQLAQERAGRPAFESWLKDLALEGIEDGDVVLGVSSEFRRAWVEGKYATMLQDCAEAAFGCPVRIRFVLAGPGDATNSHIAVLPQKPTAHPRQRSKSHQKERLADESFFGTTPLNDRFTFETFVVGKSNRLAQAGALGAAQRPGSVYNPLFIYGGVGLGKTHLMHAMGHAARGENPERRVAYLSGEAFTTQYVNAIRDRKMDDFRRRYRQADVLLVDDIQFIADKERTEEEFFHIFSTLNDLGKQIVLSSDRAPRELRIDERLRSRFESGLVADIGQPELETRIAILQRKAGQENSRIPDDVLLYMAELIQSNIRVLEGALIKVIAYASVTQSPITSQLAGDVLGAYFAGKAERGRGLQPDDVKKMVAAAFDVSVEEMEGPSRSRSIVLARQVAMHLIRVLTGASLPRIGREFGNRDHTTVVHSCRKIEALLRSDLEVAARIARLSNELRSVL